jgi:hypothetical protein
MERSGSDQTEGTVAVFAWRDEGKPRKACLVCGSVGRDLNPGPPDAK